MPITLVRFLDDEFRPRDVRNVSGGVHLENVITFGERLLALDRGEILFAKWGGRNRVLDLILCILNISFL